MRIKKLIFMLGIVLSSTPLYAHAHEISMKNNTKAYATGKLESLTKSPCSSTVSGGVVQPNGSVNLPQSVLDLYCGIKTCTGYVYVTKNCSGEAIATVTIDKEKGVTNVHNNNVQGYYVTKYDGHSVSLDGGPSA